MLRQRGCTDAAAEPQQAEWGRPREKKHWKKVLLAEIICQQAGVTDGTDLSFYLQLFTDLNLAVVTL